MGARYTYFLPGCARLQAPAQWHGQVPGPPPLQLLHGHGQGPATSCTQILERAKGRPPDTRLTDRLDTNGYFIMQQCAGDVMQCNDSLDGFMENPMFVVPGNVNQRQSPYHLQTANDRLPTKDGVRVNRGTLYLDPCSSQWTIGRTTECTNS